MDFGYHNASFEYHGTDDEQSLVDAMTDRAQFVEDAGFTWYTLMDHFNCARPASIRVSC